MFSHRSGFTLVEMIIVMAVVGILVVSLYPQIMTYLARGRDTERIADIKKITVALVAYQTKNQVLPIGTGASNKCVNEAVLQGFYVQKFPIDPISTTIHGGCSISGVYGYGTGRVLAENKAALSANFENPNGGNTGSIDIYQGDAIVSNLMSEIKFMKKGSGSGYVIHN